MFSESKGAESTELNEVFFDVGRNVIGFESPLEEVGCE